MAPRTQVNSATLIIGPTGSGKSSLARTLADYLWETHKKVLYYYACDGGGFPAKVQEGIAIGIIKGWRMRTRDPGDLGLAFETCYRAAQGWWPRRINASTGETAPGVQMVAPIAKRWHQICPNDHLVKSVASQSLLTPQKCPQCAVMVTQQNMRVQEVLTESKGFEDRGGVFFDGLTSMLSWEMMELGQRAGKMELKGEEGAIGGKVVSGDLKFGGTTRSHVGFAQTRGEELAHLALGIPHLLVPPVFTALSMEATDEAALSIVGPKIAGRAKTDEAGQWFGNCLETAKVPNLDGGVGEQFVLYLSEFTDGQGRRHLLKHRGAPGTMPEYLADPVGGMAPFSKFNLGLFFKMLDEALTAGIDAAKLIYPDAPGLPEGIEEFGDGGVPEQPQPVQAPAGATPIAEGPQVTTPPVQATQAVQAAPAAPVARGGRKKTTAPPAAVAAPSAPVALSPPTEAQDAATAAPESAGTPVVSLGTVEGAPAPPAPAVPAPAPPPQVTTPQVPAPLQPGRPVAAPPPGRRPGPPPAAAGAIPPPVANPLAQAPATSAQAPTAAAPRPPAAAPRPPAAAPRPPAAAPPTK